MARVYSGKKGKAGSKRPAVKTKPKWVKQTPEEIEQLILELAKSKNSSAMIGTILRDRYGIPDIKLIIGKTVSHVMRENKQYPDFPEDLLNLFKKSVTVREHLKLNKSDKHTLRGLSNLEAKIRRLIKYYSREGRIPKDFTYDYQKVRLLVQK